MAQFYRGVVSRETVNAGSKSEHEAAVLKLEDGSGSFILRMRDANPFEADDEFDAYIGQTVGVNGSIRDGILTVNSPSDIFYVKPAGYNCWAPKP